MKTAEKLASRRNVLKGAFGAASVTVGVPFLDCFLNSNGTALAATGQPLPVAFGTWFQHLGLTPDRWVPAKTGAGFEHNIELKVFDKLRHRMNIVSGARCYLDGRPVETHVTGAQIATMGAIPLGNYSPASIDSIIADQIGQRTRFRSVEVSLDGSRYSLSKRSGPASNPSEASPAALYARIFGPEFKDPNAADFTPDPKILAQRSVLSLVSEQRARLVSELGSSDKARLDEYFTSLRQLEQKLDIELQKPAPLEACSRPGTVEQTSFGSLIGEATANAKIFGGLLAHALACGQTRVINVLVGSNGIRKEGDANTWHAWTHFEPVDAKLGYQPVTTSFVDWANSTCADFITMLDSFKEGDKTLLDRMLVLWLTDHGYARVHTMENMPIMTFGAAAGRMKTGIHFPGNGDSVTRVGLTVQQALGVATDRWGDLSNTATKPISEFLA